MHPFSPATVQWLRRSRANGAARHPGGSEWSWLKAWAMKVAARRGIEKAIVALARRLAVILHRSWVNGTDFRWAREAQST